MIAVVVYFAGFSKQMVELLKQHNVKYGSFNILSDEEVRQGIHVGILLFSSLPVVTDIDSTLEAVIEKALSLV